MQIQGIADLFLIFNVFFYVLNWLQNCKNHQSESTIHCLIKSNTCISLTFSAHESLQLLLQRSWEDILRTDPWLWWLILRKADCQVYVITFHVRYTFHTHLQEFPFLYTIQSTKVFVRYQYHLLIFKNYINYQQFSF